MPKDSVERRKIKDLLTEKATHYEGLARSLMQADSPMSNAEISELTYSPRSPFAAGDSTRSAGRMCFDNQSVVSSSTLEPATPAPFPNIASANLGQTKLNRAMELDQRDSKPEAVKLYLEAAEHFMKAIQTCKTKGKTAAADLLKRRAALTLDHVEKLKRGKKFTNKNTTTQTKRESFTKEELAVLKESSMISSRMFLPWSDKDARSIRVDDKQDLFTDPDGFLALSAKQKERFHGWARPTEILKVRRQDAVLGSIIKPDNGKVDIVKSITPYSIQQCYVTDCSFIASLCICATFQRRFGKNLITAILHPQDRHGNPVYNPNGQYMVKLWLNGVARCVTIDDYLPIDRHGNLLCSQTKLNQVRGMLSLELWVSLIEKAYMKLCGGYDFPGSNSGVDLFSLTGWIPERVHFPKDPHNILDYETPAERAWERIFSANSYGDCLITVSTQSELTESQADAVGLVTGHAYAVLAVLETTTRSKTRLLQLKNPWAHKSWKGRYSSGDKEGWRDPSFRQEVGYDPSMHDDDGVFWICWDDILQYFQNFHLSWNPELFKYRTTMHGSWPSSLGPDDDTFNVGENPQYILNLSSKAIAEKATIWILISRHVDKQEQAGKGDEARDYLTAHIHRNQTGERIWYPGRSGNCIVTGCYTNNPHVLVRYDVQKGPEDKHLSVVLSQYKKSNHLNYTLTCYSTKDFSVGKPKGDLAHVKKVSGAWSTKTAGGPVGQDKFFVNPQYSVHVSASCIVQIGVSTTNTIAANVLLVPVEQQHHAGDALRQAQSEPVLDSGKYRHGFAITQKTKIAAGNYVAVVSNFHEDQTGLFTLTVSSSTGKVRIEKLTI